MKSRTGSIRKKVFRSWCYAFASFVLLRPAHEVGFASFRSRRHGKCNARRGLSVETFLVPNSPINGLLLDMRLNPPNQVLLSLRRCSPKGLLSRVAPSRPEPARLAGARLAQSVPRPQATAPRRRTYKRAAAGRLESCLSEPLDQRWTRKARRAVATTAGRWVPYIWPGFHRV